MRQTDDSHRSRGSAREARVRPNSGDDIRQVFAEHPRHASRMLLSIGARYETSEVIVHMLLACLLPILLVLVARIFFFGQYSIPSGSMEDTLAVHDRVFTTQKLTLNLGNLQRGDVIVFHDPAGWLGAESSESNDNDDFLIKRLIGLPGDHVQCEGNGKPILINGQAVNESSYLKPGVSPSAFPFDVHVPAGHLFVLGDNRANSADSRYHQTDGADGMVPVANVAGVALVTCWPVSHWRRLDRQHEPFANVPDVARDQEQSQQTRAGGVR
ncbi:hypothetical protein KIM372_13790 [Bombiscardovia nodaiensis]|uniref:Signal peptidase I n=1 Tax=Bombiscardovia nodaiensis TaxID=2932181 RepID=A0ABM8B996_9BIFI|nr:hypothetical protein KIM372_13790 [Bombiscardovia nodaiensis]